MTFAPVAAGTVSDGVRASTWAKLLVPFTVANTRYCAAPATFAQRTLACPPAVVIAMLAVFPTAELGAL